jgi:hypothetical protein
MIVAKDDGGVEDIEGLWGGGSAPQERSEQFEDGTWAEGVENYGDGEGEEVDGEARGFGAVGLGWGLFNWGSGRRVYGANVTFFLQCGKGWGFLTADETPMKR